MRGDEENGTPIADCSSICFLRDAHSRHDNSVLAQSWLPRFAGL